MADSPTSSGVAEEATAARPLWKAALAWCEPSLVQRLLEAQPGYKPESGLVPDVNPFPSRAVSVYATSSFLAENAGLSPDPKSAAALRCLQAAHLVSEDFRQCFEAGEITLEGLQVKPQLNTARSTVSPAWASLVKFDWINSSLWAKDAVFEQVKARRRQASQAGATGPAEGTPKQKGRPRFPMAAMVTIAAERRDTRNSSKKLEATELLEAFVKRFPNQLPPSHRTVYDHVNEIYRKAAEGGGALTS